MFVGYRSYQVKKKHQFYQISDDNVFVRDSNCGLKESRQKCRMYFYNSFEFANITNAAPHLSTRCRCCFWSQYFVQKIHELIVLLRSGHGKVLYPDKRALQDGERMSIVSRVSHSNFSERCYTFRFPARIYGSINS